MKAPLGVEFCSIVFSVVVGESTKPTLSRLVADFGSSAFELVGFNMAVPIVGLAAAALFILLLV
jgi:hypothetical protein